MNMQEPAQLDLLQRFLPVPYSFSVESATGDVQIGSNDLEIALTIRRFCIETGHPGVSMVAEWKIMRDHKAPCTGVALTLLTEETLRTLSIGHDTLLVFDISLRKVFGFIGSIPLNYLVADVLPLLLVT